MSFSTLSRVKVYSVIVCYNPDIQNLTKTCVEVKKEGVQIIIIDNTPVSYIDSKDFGEIDIIRLNDNYGIAYAQNLGIKMALGKGADIIGFFDQDSQLATGYLDNLLKDIDLSRAEVRAPVFFDKVRGAELPSFRKSSLGLLRNVYSAKASDKNLVDVVISSGSFATSRVFYEAGLMDEDFFIDFVDIEWCLRCRDNGIPIFVIPSAIMIHSIGTYTIYTRIISISVHSPERSYYKLRNTFLLLRKRNIPTILGVKEILAALIHQAAGIFYNEHRTSYIKSYFIAIKDGLIGIKGKKLERNYDSH